MASLLDLTRDHFAYEDRLMFATQYPRAADHRKQHQNLLEHIKSLAADIDDDKAGLGSFNALNSWFILHVTEDDVPLGRFIQPKQSSADPKNIVGDGRQDRFEDIKERLQRSKTAPKSAPSWADIQWLVTEVDRLRSDGAHER